jgi:hypothetical protein
VTHHVLRRHPTRPHSLFPLSQASTRLALPRQTCKSIDLNAGTHRKKKLTPKQKRQIFVEAWRKNTTGGMSKDSLGERRTHGCILLLYAMAQSVRLVDHLVGGGDVKFGAFSGSELLVDRRARERMRGGHGLCGGRTMALQEPQVDGFVKSRIQIRNRPHSRDIRQSGSAPQHNRSRHQAMGGRRTPPEAFSYEGSV